MDSEERTLDQADLDLARSASLARPAAPDVPGYRLDRRLGSGSFGEVWSGLQFSTGQAVAVKLLHRGGAAYLERELARLRSVSDHPNVVSLIDANLAHQPPFVVTPLLERSLEGVTSDGVEDWLDQVVRALDFVHSRGVLHCDLKPANLLLDREGAVRVVDFGQAVSAGASEVSLGTLFYMPAEQARQEPPAAGWDVYALGATFYQLLTGRLPRATPEFRQSLSRLGGTRETLQRYGEGLAGQALTPLRQLNPRVDPELAAVLEHCLELDPDRRYRTMGEVVADLGNRRRGYPLTCRPRTPAYLARRFLARNRVSVAVGAVATALLAATVTAAFVGVSAQRDQALLAEARSSERLANFLFHTGLSAGGTESVLRLAEAADQSPDPQSFPDPREREEVAHLTRLRRVAAAAYLRAAPRLLWERRGPLADVAEDGSALVEGEGTVDLYDPEGRRLHSFRGSEGSFDAAGGLLVIRDEDRLQVYERSGQAVGPTLPAGDAFALAGGRLAVVDQAGVQISEGGRGVEKLSLPGAALVTSPYGGLAAQAKGRVRFLPGVEAEADQVGFSPSGPALLVRPYRLQLVEPGSGRLLWERTSDSREVEAMAFSPDGELVAVALKLAVGSRLEVRETTSGEPQGDPLASEYSVLALDFDESSRVLAAGCSDGKVRLWEVGGFPFQARPLAWAPIEHEGPVTWVQLSRGEVLSLTEDGVLRRFALPAPPGVLAVFREVPAQLQGTGDRLLARTATELKVFRKGRLALERTYPELLDAWLLEGRVLARTAPERLEEIGGDAYELPGPLQALRPDGRAALVDWKEIELASGRVLRQAPPADPPVRYSPDGRWAVAMAPDRGGVVPLFGPAWAELEIEPRVMDARVGVEGVLAWNDGMAGSALVVEAGAGREPRSFRHGAWVSEAVYSPDGEWVLTVSQDGTARVLSVSTFAPAAGPLSHGGVALARGAFSPDSARIVTVDENSCARVWDRRTGLPLTPLLPHRKEVEPVFLPDGRLVLVWGTRLAVWDFPEAGAQALGAARARVGRER